jgi:hypothetical protein
MAATDTTVKGLESLIVAALTGHIGEAAPEAGVVREPIAPLPRSN